MRLYCYFNKPDKTIIAVTAELIEKVWASFDRTKNVLLFSANREGHPCFYGVSGDDPDACRQAFNNDSMKRYADYAVEAAKMGFTKPHLDELKQELGMLLQSKLIIYGLTDMSVTTALDAFYAETPQPVKIWYIDGMSVRETFGCGASDGPKPDFVGQSAVDMEKQFNSQHVDRHYFR